MEATWIFNILLKLINILLLQPGLIWPSGRASDFGAEIDSGVSSIPAQGGFFSTCSTGIG